MVNDQKHLIDSVVSGWCHSDAFLLEASDLTRLGKEEEELLESKQSNLLDSSSSPAGRLIETFSDEFAKKSHCSGLLFSWPVGGRPLPVRVLCFLSWVIGGGLVLSSLCPTVSTEHIPPCLLLIKRQRKSGVMLASSSPLQIKHTCTPRPVSEVVGAFSSNCDMNLFLLHTGLCCFVVSVRKCLL